VEREDLEARDSGPGTDHRTRFDRPSYALCSQPPNVSEVSDPEGVTSVTSDGGARGATLASQLPKLEGKRELVFTQRSSGGSSSFIAVDITEVYIFFSHPPTREKSGTRVSRDYRTVLPDLIDVAVVNPLRALKGYDVVFVPSKCPSDSTQVGSDFSD
jgi:hypothetical protein